MKNKFTSVLVLYSLFSGVFQLRAQDSKEILNLKQKSANVSDPKNLVEINKSLANTYNKNGVADSAIVYAKKMIPYYEATRDRERAGNLQLMLVSLNSKIDNTEMMRLHFDNAEKYYNDLTLENKIYLNNIGGHIHDNFYNSTKKAIHYYEKNIDLYHSGKNVDKKKIDLTYQALISLYSRKNYDYANTLKITNDYLKFTEKEFPNRLADIHAYLGSFYWQVGFNQKSIQEFEKALQLYQKQKGKEDYIYGIKNMIGANYMSIKVFDKAKKNAQEAFDYFKKNNDAKSLSSVYNLLSHIAYQEEKFLDAKEYIVKAIEIIPDSAETNLYNKAYLGTIKYKILMQKDSLNIKKDLTKYKELEIITNELSHNFEKIEAKKNDVTSGLLLHNYNILADAYGMLGNYDKAYYYLDKTVKQREKSYSVEKVKALSEAQGEQQLNDERIRIKLEEETKRIQLQKEIELKALRFEYEKKQAAAKTEEERKRLALEEDLKRKEIQIKFDQEQKAVVLRYNQEKNIARINQEKKDAIAKAELESSQNQKNIWAVGAGLSLLLLGFAGFSYNQKRKDNKKIAEEKQKSDDLLLNILPYEVAEELKEKGKTNAKHYDEVSVLFTDFVNFTSNSERIGVQEVLNELNICFTEFDRIMEKYNLEKIKTIGDAYLAVSGLPVSNVQHAKNAVNASLEILSYIQHRKQESPNALDIRIGIHSGPVIAGIVGVKKFAYDIWGDTVNTAARMEQNSALGKLNVSEATYQLIKDDFSFEYRGKIETKGKGAMEMYFVNQI
ncbi:hypothetical protein NZ698_07030 [Chryseobacterium sp. PBS4-4]|uniref:Guanylate cyclase domain-containing protein n=1 Tax=Chryseobacterium edaphi TaxID=2976532 RepID=A0ABT2W411_9FLAO|nr:adenylate/guanylate cyclase domain-containing protein [Chryseobacterium edaphi]MCU7616945.1 hypothetical protein [Chryseobacterium edaphi]